MPPTYASCRHISKCASTARPTDSPHHAEILQCVVEARRELLVHIRHQRLKLMAQGAAGGSSCISSRLGRALLGQLVGLGKGCQQLIGPGGNARLRHLMAAESGVFASVGLGFSKPCKGQGHGSVCCFAPARSQRVTAGHLQSAFAHWTRAQPHLVADHSSNIIPTTCAADTHTCTHPQAHQVT